MEKLIIPLILICLIAYAALHLYSLRRLKHQPSDGELPICDPILYRYDCLVGLAQFDDSLSILPNVKTYMARIMVCEHSVCVLALQKVPEAVKLLVFPKDQYYWQEESECLFAGKGFNLTRALAVFDSDDRIVLELGMEQTSGKEAELREWLATHGFLH